jgi:hypothetical protein
MKRSRPLVDSTRGQLITKKSTSDTLSGLCAATKIKPEA